MVDWRRSQYTRHHNLLASVAPITGPVVKKGGGRTAGKKVGRNASIFPYALPIANASFETAFSASDWVAVRDTPAPSAGPSSNGTVAYDGGFFWYGREAANSTSLQTITLDGSLQSDIDANKVTLTLSHWAAGSFDVGCMTVTALNASGVAISCYVQDLLATDDEPNWSQRTFDFKLPPGTRGLRLYLDCRRKSGVSNDYYFDLVEGELNSAAPTAYALPILQCDAVDGVDEWTVTAGELKFMNDLRLPRSGANCFYAGTNAQSTAHQDVAVPAAAEASIDAGTATISWEWWQYCFDTDRSRIRLEFYEGDGTTLISSNIPAYSNFRNADWTRVTHSAAVPVNTRFVRFIIDMNRTSGSSNDAYTDALKATITI